MTALVHTLNERGFKTVRLSDDELHRSARKHLLEAGDALFGNLPSIMGQIIEHRVWKTRPSGFKSFAEYALAQTSDGLNISNNQRLWMLRCTLDITGAHVKEWAEVMDRVDTLVRLYVEATPGSKLSDFSRNSLEQLSKDVRVPDTTQRITYLPSRSGSGTFDQNLIELQKKYPDLYRQVTSRKLTLREATKIARVGEPARDVVDRAASIIRRMNKKDMKRLLEWLRDEGHI